MILKNDVCWGISIVSRVLMREKVLVLSGLVGERERGVQCFH